MTNIAHGASEVPMLHAKYVAKLAKSRLSLRKSEADYWRLRSAKTRYFRGEMDRKELTERNWEPYQYPKPLKTELDNILAMDEDMLVQGDKTEYWKTVVAFLEQIMKSINSRTWDFKNVIEMTKINLGN